MTRLAARGFTRAGLALPVATLIGLVAMAPLGLFVVVSFFKVDLDNYVLIPAFSLASWGEVWTHGSYWVLIGRSLSNGVIAVAMTAVVGYPLALALSRLPAAAKGVALVVLLTPLYTGEIVRIYAWRLVLGQNGLVNAALMATHLISEPLRFLLFSPFATHLALFYDDLPFMTLALWVAVERVDPRLIEAARDLGCRPLGAFRRVILPLTGPGLASGVFMVFALAGGEALAPNLLGGASSATPMSMIDSLFGAAFDWPTASALALTLLFALLVTAFALSGLALWLSGGARQLRRSLA